MTPTEGGIAISQSRFLLTPDPADLTQWKLPLQVRGMAGGSAFSSKLLLDGSSTVLAVDGSIDWVIANAGGHGFYRTWYDDSLFGALMDDIGALDALERYTLVDDAWAFVESGQARAASFLRVASAFENEREQAIWTALLTGASGIGHHPRLGSGPPEVRAVGERPGGNPGQRAGVGCQTGRAGSDTSPAGATAGSDGPDGQPRRDDRSITPSSRAAGR